MSDLPNGWTEYSIGDVIKVKNGYAFKSKEYSKEGIPIVRISDIQDGKIDLTNSARISKSKANLDFKIVKGDLLIALSGATTGKVGVFRSDEVALQNQRVGNFKIINERILAKSYRDYFIFSLRKQIELAAYGGAQPNISSSELEEFEIPLPPLNEQKRIVAKLDKLISKVETAKTRLDKIPQTLKRFRQSVLSAAVSGELTKDWRVNNNNGKSGEFILNKIQKELGTEKITTESINGFEIPLTWVIGKLGAITELIGKGSSPTWQGIKYVDQGILFITSENVGDGKLLITNKKYLEQKFNEKQKRTILRKGDVLTNLVGASIGRSAIFDLDETANINQAVCLIRLHPLIDNKFLLYFLNSRRMIDLLNELKVDVARANVSLTDVRNFDIPIASIEEQKEIVRRVEQLFKFADQIEERYNKAKQYVDKLTQSILAKAFRGELVPQNPVDEPASELLKKIKADKELLITSIGKRNKKADK